MNRIAANPIPYWLAGGKTREVFEEAFRDFQEIGFTAVKADVTLLGAPGTAAGSPDHFATQSVHASQSQTLARDEIHVPRLAVR